MGLLALHTSSLEDDNTLYEFEESELEMLGEEVNSFDCSLIMMPPTLRISMMTKKPTQLSKQRNLM